MKIAIDITPTLYKGTGVATYYNNLIPELLKIGKSHNFILFGYSLRRSKDLTLATRKFPLPPALMHILWNKLHIIPIEALLGKVDVLHTWDYIQAPTKEAQIVTTIHDLTPLIYPQHQHPKTITAYREGLKWVKKEAAAIITDSQATKKDIINLLDIPEKNIIVIYLAASEKFTSFRNKSEQEKNSKIDILKKTYKISGDYLLFVGTQEPRKNLSRVIQAYKLIKSEMQLVIAGNTGWGKQVEKEKGVHLIGYVEPQDLAALYSGASLFIYPSLYEGFGLPVLEAMSVGCPVLTSDRGSLKEIAGGAAVTVNPESIEAIASGIRVALARGPELAQKGILQAQKFSWKETAARTVNVYDSLQS